MNLINRFFGALVFWPLAIVVAAIAVANRKAVLLSFDPFNAAAPAIAFPVPLYIVVLGSALVGLVLGPVELLGASPRATNRARHRSKSEKARAGNRSAASDYRAAL